MKEDKRSDDGRKQQWRKTEGVMMEDRSDDGRQKKGGAEEWCWKPEERVMTEDRSDDGRQKEEW
jgi:hypothetical protein